jgi:hypothetical protein
MVVNREPTRSDTGERGLWTCAVASRASSDDRDTDERETTR